MEYTRTHGVFEVVDEECYGNGCNPLALKWVDNRKGDVRRSRLVCREIRRPATKMNCLGQKTNCHQCRRRRV